MENFTDKSDTICIVGGGPVGLFLALVLSKQDFKTEVFEKRDAIRDESHAIGLAISARGLYAISMIGIDVLSLNIMKLYGRGVHNELGEYNFHNYGRKDEHLCAIDRNYLHAVLMEMVEKDQNIKLHKGVKITDIYF